MAEKPILFSAPMVRAILEGRKTQTRRIVKPEPQMVTDKSIVPWAGDPAVLMKQLERSGQNCQYGKSGGWLWVRETYLVDEEDGKILYRANKDDFQIILHNKVATGSPRYNWRPSIFMPRSASRITLEIVSLRVERLHDISEADAMAEGITHSTMNNPRVEYQWLWESINGSGSWDLNPWVWVISFARNQET